MIYQTADLTPHTQYGPGEELQVYCGLDCCLTIEVWQAIRQQLIDRPQAQSIYDFERALQAPYMEIMQRGFMVDDLARKRAAHGLILRQIKLKTLLNEFADACWGRPLNANSPAQLADFFYRACKIPEVLISQKGIRRVSTNREALEKIDHHMHMRPIISLILTIRDIAKQLDIFEQDIDSDNRFRTSYNIAGTETGRASSSENAFGTGGNAQNISAPLRYIFVSDPGWKLCVIDLEQVEARDVGFFEGCLFNDWSFLDACEGGDLHTLNSKLIWPELGWTGDPNEDKHLADNTMFYRNMSYRAMAKRGSHLSNYSGSAWTMARSLKLPIAVADDFQARYCRGSDCVYPAHQRWWQWTATQLQTTHSLTTPFGRQRHFYGRPDDDATLREAIAYLPQSTTADRTNLGLWRAWRYEPDIQLLAQTHDSITFQVREGPQFDPTVARVLRLVSDIGLIGAGGRRYSVPGEAKVGWNWGYQSELLDGQIINPEGLMKWKPSQPDPRIRRTGLSRIVM